MTARHPAGHDPDPTDGGFTLVELLIAIVLSTLIIGVVSAAMVTSLNVANSTTAQVADSTDAGLTSSFFIRDAESAGATDPLTARRDATLGVTTDQAAAAWTGCAQPAAFVVRFSWVDRTSAPLLPATMLAPAATTVVAYYFLDSTNAQLTRRICRSGTTVDVLLASHLSSVAVACDAACTGVPVSVSMTLKGSGLRAPFEYTLKASLRTDTQTAPTTANSAPVPLLALGAGAAVACPNLTLADGIGAVAVVGNVLVDASCGAAPISGSQAPLRPTGSTGSLVGIVDPFVSRVAPTSTCAGTNPATIGVSANRDTVTAYPQKVTITADTVFQPGRYVFCNGLEITGGQVKGTDALWYVAAGTLAVGPTATVDVTGRASGTDAGLLAWVASSGQTVSISSGTRVANLRGVIYTPKSTLQLSTVDAANIGGVVAKSVTVAGAGRTRLGLPLPVLTFAPATIPAGQVGVAYAATVTASGGTAPYTYAATGLPAELTIDRSTGVISGTPATAGALNVTVTAFDATAQAASADYGATVATALSATWPASLPTGQVGVVYPTTTPTAGGGTAPYAWSATGLPAGLSVSATTGAVSGTPTAGGSFTLALTVTDAMGAKVTKSYPVTVNAALAAAWPATVPAAQVGVAYSTSAPTASGGTTPYTWSATGLPPGLTIDAASGVVLGTPTASGSVTSALKLTDAMAASVTKSYTFTIAAAAPAAVTCPSAPAGWQGQYYANVTLSGAMAACRDDASINFDWGTGAPVAGMPADNFSVRWTRTQTFAAGTYTFALGTDDGGRLYIDGVLVIDRWVDQTYPTPPPTLTKTMTQGAHTMVVEYYERAGPARATFVITPPNGVTAAVSVDGDMTYYGSDRIILSNTPAITALSATITVVLTPGLSLNGQYETYGNGWIASTNVTAGGSITFRFVLNAGQTMTAGLSGMLAAQFNGAGTLHPTSGDTWTVTTTTALGTQTVSGTF